MPIDPLLALSMRVVRVVSIGANGGTVNHLADAVDFTHCNDPEFNKEEEEERPDLNKTEDGDTLETCLAVVLSLVVMLVVLLLAWYLWSLVKKRKKESRLYHYPEPQRRLNNELATVSEEYRNYELPSTSIQDFLKAAYAENSYKTFNHVYVNQNYLSEDEVWLPSLNGTVVDELEDAGLWVKPVCYASIIV